MDSGDKSMTVISMAFIIAIASIFFTMIISTVYERTHIIKYEDQKNNITWSIPK